MQTMNSSNTHFVEPMITVKCLVLQISQDGRFLWGDYKTNLV